MDFEEMKYCLTTIKNACKETQERKGCVSCPCGSKEGDCLVTDSVPKNWDVKNPDFSAKLLG